MVAQLLRLRVTLLANTFRRRPLQLAGMVIGLLLGIGLAGVLTVGMASLRFTTPEIARAVITVLGALVILGFLLLPLVFGVDDAIDPRRFALFGIPTSKLALTLAVTAFVSVPGLVIAVLSVAQVMAWTRGPGPVAVAVAAALIIVPTCVLASRVATGVASSLLASRRARDASGTVLLLVLAVSAPLVALLATIDWQSQGLPVMRRIATAIMWTPLGALWSAPGDAALGDTDSAMLKIAIGLGFLALLAIAWRGIVGALLAAPPRTDVVRRYSGLGWFERLPATPLGAIAARSLSYWGRDARYRVSLAVIPIVPIVMVTALLVAGVPVDLIIWIPVPIMCLFLGWTVHNDIAYDSTAFWAHVSASTRGSDDRWGRLIPALFVGVPLALVGSVATVLIAGRVAVLPALVGLSVCVLFTALGVSSVISAAFPYPATRPGDSPFSQPQAAGAAGSVVQALSLGVTIVFALPVLALVILFPTLPDLQVIALAIGLATGLLVLIGGVYWGAHLVNRRAPELLAFTLQN